MIRGHARIEAKSRRRGFTLVELLIAIAIFSILMVSIAAMFVGSIRAARAGRQSIDAFEESRGAFDLAQRDLMTAFTSRDYAQYYSFFGMPYGFMFVGLVRGQRATDSEANLARVTYVLRRMSDQQQFQTIGTDSATGDTVDVTVETCSLLRFVEVGVQDLDTFVLVPDGDVAQSWEDLSGEWPSVSAILSDVEARYDASDPAAGITPVIQEKMKAAMKCELWIRMLAGPDICTLYQDMWLRAQADSVAGEQPYRPLPIIDDPSSTYGVLPDFWTLVDKDPADYVVADNVFFRAYLTDDPSKATIESGIYISPDYDLPETPLSICYFQYGRQNILPVSDPDPNKFPTYLTPFWISESNATLRDLGSLPTLLEPYDVQLGSPLVPRIPEIMKMRLTFLLESPYPGAPDFRRQLEQVIDIPAGYVRTKRN